MYWVLFSIYKCFCLQFYPDKSVFKQHFYQDKNCKYTAIQLISSDIAQTSHALPCTSTPNFVV